MLTLAKVFGDNMVLQRQKDIAIWGTAEPMKEILVRLLSKEGTILSQKKGVSCSDGTWKLRLPALEAASGLSMTAETDRDFLSYKNVSIGEVWVAGGQSNMEYYIEYDIEKEAVLQGPMNPYIFFFDYPEVSYEEELEQYDYSEMGIWRECTPDNLPWFSAVGYYFANKLQEALQVPIGILGCNWGGTPACAWMSEEYLEASEGRIWLDEYRKDLEGKDLALYRKLFRSNPGNDHSHPISQPSPIMFPGFFRERQLQEVHLAEEAALKAAKENANYPLMPIGPGPDHPWRPCGLYKTMLQKIAPFTARGVIWYQGESDEPHAEVYDKVFEAMIGNWRSLWQEELPFLFVQLAPFEEWMHCSGERFPILRECQQQVADTMSGTWMCSTSDVGMQWDIHPKQKRPVGERLALLARGHVYGEELLCDAPEPEEIGACDDGLYIRFRHGEGLYLQSLSGMKVMSGDINALFLDGRPCEGRVAGNVLYIDGTFKGDLKISFAKTPYYEVNLYNAAGIPVKPFEKTVKI